MLMVELRSFPQSTCVSHGSRTNRELRHPRYTYPAANNPESKRLRRWIYSRANQQTARPDRLGIVWLMSSCLISALTLSAGAGEPVRMPEVSGK